MISKGETWDRGNGEVEDSVRVNVGKVRELIEVVAVWIVLSREDFETFQTKKGCHCDLESI